MHSSIVQLHYTDTNRYQWDVCACFCWHRKSVVGEISDDTRMSSSTWRRGLNFNFITANAENDVSHWLVANGTVQSMLYRLKAYTHFWRCTKSWSVLFVKFNFETSVTGQFSQLCFFLPGEVSKLTTEWISDPVLICNGKYLSKVFCQRSNMSQHLFCTLVLHILNFFLKTVILSVVFKFQYDTWIFALQWSVKRIKLTKDISHTLSETNVVSMD